MTSGEARHCDGDECGSCSRCCEELLLGDLAAYESRYQDAVAEALPQVEIVPDEDAGDRATIHHLFDRGVHIAHVRQALADAGRYISVGDPLGIYRYALRLLWDRVMAAPQVPRPRGAPWCLAEDQRLMRALHVEERLASVADSLGCSPGAVLGRAQRLAQHGAFPKARLAIWASDLAGEPATASRPDGPQDAARQSV